MSQSRMDMDAPAVGPWRPTLLAAAALALIGGLFVPFDGPIAQFFLDRGCPRDLQKLFGLAELFGHGTGVLLILATVFVLDPRGCRAAAWVAAAAYGGGLSADLLKLLVWRTRPNAVQGRIVGWETFQAWLPWITAGRSGQSFPSAHTATAAGLAVALATLYPRGRWLFAGFAVLAGCQRVESGAHFPSDVLWGAAVGLLVGTALMRIHARWSAPACCDASTNDPRPTCPQVN